MGLVTAKSDALESLLRTGLPWRSDTYKEQMVRVTADVLRTLTGRERIISTFTTQTADCGSCRLQKLSQVCY